jgi:biopolymer transport protein ExbD
MEIPRLRYEVLTRTVRTGNLPPVANAGPNQTLSSAQTVTLNGSASYDPDGDPITFQWTQELGPTVALSAPTNKITTFSAAAGQTYSFMLTVTDSLGARGTARVRIDVGSGSATILSFVANPTTINVGQSSTLSWQVTNADTVSITSLGSVALTGAQAVSPAVTTTYILTATKGSVSTTAAATVTVNGTSALPVIASFVANPTTITAGQSSTLSWATQNATSVSITSLGSVALNGSQGVTPSTTTTYSLTAVNAAGSVTAQATVTVTGSGGTTIANFTANPSTIDPGGKSVLTCNATGANSVAINGVSTPGNAATTTVSPAQTTTYTCVATGPNNQTDTKQVTVTVTAGTAPIIVISGGTSQYVDRRHIILDATATSSPNGNMPLKFHWTSVNFGATALSNPDSATPDIVLPPILGAYSFTLTVTDSKGNSSTSTITLILTAINVF